MLSSGAKAGLSYGVLWRLSKVCKTWSSRGYEFSIRVSVEGERVDTRKINNEKVYRSVKVASLGNRRRGKHHDLVGGIMRQLKSLNAGSALEIPLTGVADVELENLRSAVHRAGVRPRPGYRADAGARPGRGPRRRLR